jgi:uncharacterized membrane protein/thiol-disulfide isomerase/thioredoxin
MKCSSTIRKISIILVLSFLLSTKVVFAEQLVVHAILFFSPSCPHCYEVVTEDIPPLMEEYNEQLIILGINTYTETGHELYQAAIRQFKIPPERQGVPTLIVGQNILVGSNEIPQQLPVLIEGGLANGGIDWPPIPGLQELIAADNLTEPENETTEQDVADRNLRSIEEESTEADVNVGETEKEKIYGYNNNNEITGDVEKIGGFTESLTVSDRFMQDKIGNTLSSFVLIGMALSVLWVGNLVLKSKKESNQWPKWTIPLLLMIGLIIAIYMGYVEINQTDAVCGPVGDCNTVQQSKYAYLFGIIPIGVFCVVGYLAIGVLWVSVSLGPKKWHDISILGIWVFSLLGTLFSIYLTFLEPFVIGATCAWCLSSAVIMTLLLWVSTPLLIQIKAKGRRLYAWK